MKYQPGLLNFIDFSDKTIEDSYCTKENDVNYVNGQKLKEIIKRLQPSEQSYQRINFNPYPSETCIKQNMSGPSAEIILTTTFFQEQEDKRKFISFLRNILDRLEKLFKFYVNSLNWFCTVERIATFSIDEVLKWKERDEGCK